MKSYLNQQIEKKEAEGYQVFKEVGGFVSPDDKRSNLYKALQLCKTTCNTHEVIYVVGAHKRSYFDGFKMAVMYKPRREEYFEVVQNEELNRLQLVFNGKPEDDERAVLKKRGFKWSPKNKVWQRQLTDNAIISTQYIIADFENLGRCNNVKNYYKNNGWTGVQVCDWFSQKKGLMQSYLHQSQLYIYIKKH